MKIKNLMREMRVLTKEIPEDKIRMEVLKGVDRLDQSLSQAIVIINKDKDKDEDEKINYYKDKLLDITKRYRRTDGPDAAFFEADRILKIYPELLEYYQSLIRNHQ